MPPCLLLQPREQELLKTEMPEEIWAPARASHQWHRAALVVRNTQQPATCLTSRFSPPDGREISNYPLIINQFPVILS